ncbi:TM2 domain-containing protein [Streptomyces yokosukanensis]|uniref:TM2 domain-containing protein n=1 Tax=Streptomyces yokosukanensis TaxID=67386 RepID=UPI00099E880E
MSRWSVLGLFGAHCFYLGKNRRGLLYLCALGCAGWAGWSTSSPSCTRSAWRTSHDDGAGVDAG